MTIVTISSELGAGGVVTSGGTADLSHAEKVARNVPGVREVKIVELEPLPGVI